MGSWVLINAPWYYPRFIAGERNCPPEDCGGISGFYEMLDARPDPSREEHADICRWLDDYDPEELDIFPIQVALGRIAAKRNAAAKRIISKKGSWPSRCGPHRMGTMIFSLNASAIDLLVKPSR